MTKGNNVMKKNILFYLFLLIAACLVMYQTGDKSGDEKEKRTVKIGAVLALTGDLSEYGKAVQDGITLALEEINKEDNNFNYEVIFEDDQFDPKRTASAINKLVYMDKVEAVLSTTSGTANVIAPIVEKEKIVHIGYADDNSVAAKNRYSFNRNVRYEDMTAKVIELFNKRDVKDIYFVNFIHSSAKRLMGALKPVVEAEEGFNIVGEDWVNSTDRDFRAIGEKIKRINPDGVYLYVLEPNLTLIGKELQKIGYEGEIITSYLFSYAKHKELFEGNYFVNTEKPNKEFTHKFMKKFGYEPNIGSGEVYDNLKMMVDGFEKNKSTNADEFIKIIKDVVADYDGAFGKVGMTSEDLIYGGFIINKIVDGKIQ